MGENLKMYLLIFIFIFFCTEVHLSGTVINSGDMNINKFGDL